MRWLFSNHLEEEVCSLFEDELFYPDNEFFCDVVNWIKEGRIQVRVFVGEEFINTNNLKKIEFLHGKAYLFSETRKSTSGHVLIGSSNFTQGGLVKNRELNIYSNDTWRVITDWFSEIWENYSIEYSRELINELETEKKQGIINWTEYEKTKKYTPVGYVYYQLAKFYGEKKDLTLEQRIRTIENSLPYPLRKDGSKFFIHQRQGIEKVYEKLLKQDTVVLADGVGLGKTLETATVIKLFLEDFSQSNDKRKILILANSRLEEQWHFELRNVKVNRSDYDIITRQSFALKTDEDLDFYAEYYGLIIIDEAHEGFLKIKNRAYQRMQELIIKSRNNKSRELRGLLMTATPWNNSREDVIRLGTLFLNSEKIDLGRQYRSYVINNNLSSMYETKRRQDINQVAYEQFWNDIFIQRTRFSLSNENHLSDKYPKRVFPLEQNGDEPYRIGYSPEVSLALNNILEKLIRLKLPYQDTIIQYFSDSESNLLIRQRQQLLRRADSSNVAFKRSLENIDKRLKMFNQEIEELQTENLSTVKQYFKSLIDKRFKEVEDTFELDLDFSEDEEWLNDIGQAKLNRLKLIDQALTESNLTNYLNRIITDIKKDRAQLKSILENWRKISDDDRKKKAICEEISKELEHGNKVLLFTEFVDTARDYYNSLMANPQFSSHGVGFVSGKNSSANNEVVDKEDVLGRFSPSSKKYKHELLPGKEINILIGTDAISTGQNLQDATVVMTIELPYNPMRLEQRIGRIDRPKELLNGEISIYAFPSDEIINAEIALLSRYQLKAESASYDTNSDINLPFMKDIKENGLRIALERNEVRENTFDFLSKPMEVSEQEAKYRLYNYYEENVDYEQKYLDGIELFPKYAFTKINNMDIYLVCGELKDINGKIVEMIDRPKLFTSHCNEIPLVEAEASLFSGLSNYCYSVSEFKEELAQQAVADINKDLFPISEYIINEFNKNNAEKINAEDNNSQLVRELANELNSKKREYILNFKNSEVNPKIFSNIVNALPNRGFNNKQKDFIRNLRGEDGKLNLKLVRDKIWNELTTFMYIFEEEFHEENKDNSISTRNNADIEKSTMEFLGVLKNI
nr:helicase-related protein [Enterococcus sp. BWB1-3]